MNGRRFAAVDQLLQSQPQSRSQSSGVLQTASVTRFVSPNSTLEPSHLAPHPLQKFLDRGLTASVINLDLLSQEQDAGRRLRVLSKSIAWIIMS